LQKIDQQKISYGSFYMPDIQLPVTTQIHYPTTQRLPE